MNYILEKLYTFCTYILCTVLDNIQYNIHNFVVDSFAYTYITEERSMKINVIMMLNLSLRFENAEASETEHVFL